MATLNVLNRTHYHHTDCVSIHMDGTVTESDELLILLLQYYTTITTTIV